VTELRDMFLPDARVTRIAAGQIEFWSVDEFIAPRAAMLTDGTLVNCHEWEVEEATTISGQIAEHRSRYRKSGQVRGDAYSSEGRKLFLLCWSERHLYIVSCFGRIFEVRGTDSPTSRPESG
jgi:hypothetical protein